MSLLQGLFCCLCRRHCSWNPLGSQAPPSAVPAPQSLLLTLSMCFLVLPSWLAWPPQRPLLPPCSLTPCLPHADQTAQGPPWLWRPEPWPVGQPHRAQSGTSDAQLVTDAFRGQDMALQSVCFSSVRGHTKVGPACEGRPAMMQQESQDTATGTLLLAGDPPTVEFAVSLLSGWLGSSATSGFGSEI